MICDVAVGGARRTLRRSRAELGDGLVVRSGARSAAGKHTRELPKARAFARLDWSSNVSDRSAQAGARTYTPDQPTAHRGEAI